MADDKWGAGDPSKWSDWGTVRIGKTEYPLIWGEHKHSYSENKMYVLINDKPVEFNGHRILVDMQFKSRNYLKESELSGNEYRKGGSCEIIADGDVIYEFFYRDIQWALIKAHGLIGEISEHPSGWINKDEREKLVGRSVYYRGTAAIIERLIVDQGCMILKPEGMDYFPQPPWRDDDYDDEPDITVKVEVLDPNIWWWRK